MKKNTLHVTIFLCLLFHFSFATTDDDNYDYDIEEMCGRFEVPATPKSRRLVRSISVHGSNRTIPLKSKNQIRLVITNEGCKVQLYTKENRKGVQGKMEFVYEQNRNYMEVGKNFTHYTCACEHFSATPTIFLTFIII